MRSLATARSETARPPRSVHARPETLPTSMREVGTFKDNKSAPIHRWFQYPAGFSYRAVDHALGSYRLGPAATVYDPFAGSGTTLVACKARGVPSVGAEAHPLVAKIARTKVAWDLDLVELRRQSVEFLRRLPAEPPPLAAKRLPPELVQKCFDLPNLLKLLAIRDRLPRVPEPYRAVLEVALVGTLRSASTAATGWPYIAPRKRIAGREAYAAFRTMLERCLADLEATSPAHRRVPSRVLEADARSPGLPPGTVDLAFTSPPYLNNYDYADRLRLESYFLGLAETWGEISRRFRSRLVVSATTQVARSDGEPSELVREAVGPIAPEVSRELQAKVRELSRRRKERTGQKSYDLMVARYFVDMTAALQATFEALRPGGRFVLILGDSAPYGVPVPTEALLGAIGVGLGFRSYRTAMLRTRGGKWRSNPQRHHEPLRESWLVLER